MKRLMVRYLSVGVAAACTVTGSMAADLYRDEPTIEAPAYAAPAEEYPGADLVFRFGLGAQTTSAFPGSESGLDWSPAVFFGLEYLRIPGWGEVANVKKNPSGLSIRPSFTIRNGRKPSDDTSLAGTSKRKRTFELGARVAYRFGWIEPYVTVRYGIGGHKSTSGEFGVRAFVDPADNLALSFGPEAHWGSSKFIDYFYGVGAADAAVLGKPQSKGKGGIFRVGLKAEARYDFTELWAVHAGAAYYRRVGNSHESPFYLRDSRNDYEFSLGVSRKFSIDLF